jgi:hypothetical protein
VFVRNTLRRPDAIGVLPSPGWSSELAVDSARIGVNYRKRDLRIEVEIEFADGKGEIRDASIRLQPRSHLRLQAGRFKKPISAVSMESRWSLPALERGLLNDFALGNELTGAPDELPVGGRDLGVQVELRDKKARLKPRLVLGVFRSQVHKQLAEALGANRVPLNLSAGFSDDVIGRVELEPWRGVRAGVSVGWTGMLETSGTRDTFRHGYVGSGDLVIDLAPIRMWLEGFAGTSPVHFGINLQAEGRFVAARTIVAARIKTKEHVTWMNYVEPYGMAHYLDASSEVEQDTAYELGGGLNLGFTKTWRLGLAFAHRVMDARLVGGGTELITQLGAVF